MSDCLPASGGRGTGTGGRSNDLAQCPRLGTPEDSSFLAGSCLPVTSNNKQASVPVGNVHRTNQRDMLQTRTTVVWTSVMSPCRTASSFPMPPAPKALMLEGSMPANAGAKHTHGSNHQAVDACRPRPMNQPEHATKH